MPQGTYGAKSASSPGTFHSSIQGILLPQFQPSLAHILAADCSSIELLKAPEDSEIPLLMQYSTLCINIRTESRSGMFSYLRAGILKTPLSSNISFSIMQQESRPPMDMSSCEWSRDLRAVLFARSLYPSKVLTPRPPHTTTRRRLITNQRFQVVGANALGFTGPTLSASQAVHHFGHCTNFGVLWLRDYLDLAPRQGT